MKKRAFVLFIAIVWGFLISLGKAIVVMNDKTYSEAGETQSSSTVTIDNGRGTIYDCNMLPFTNSVSIYKGSVCATPQAVSQISEYFSGEERDMILERLKSGLPIVIKSPEKLSASGTFFAKCCEYYNSDNVLAPHIIGYLDGEGNGVCGTEKAFNDLLKNEKPLSATYYLDARNSALLGVAPEISGLDEHDTNKGVVLTLDCRIQKICEDAAKKMLPLGAVVVQDISTGDIKACVSTPSFSVTDVASALKNDDSPLINRAFTPYNAGSVFKLCVAAAALENGTETSFSYTCEGSLKIGNTVYNCNNHKGHGTLDLTGGLCKSCNTYFINLAVNTGASAVYDMAEKMGFGKKTVFGGSLVSEKGNLPQLYELQKYPGELANFAFGQGKLLVTPVQISGMVTSIANGGLYMTPSLVLGTADSEQNVSFCREIKSERIMSAQTAEILKKMMLETVSGGTGKNAQIAVGAGGKTASAETGWTKNGKSVTQCWFSGFFPAVNPRYTVTVLAEDGKSGSSSAAPVFAEIAKIITELGL